MTGSKRCKVILAFGQHAVGSIIRPTGLVRDQLRARGYIEVLDDDPIIEAPKVKEPEPEPKPEPEPNDESDTEEVAVVAEVETAMRRRGRPRKEVE